MRFITEFGSESNTLKNIERRLIKMAENIEALNAKIAELNAAVAQDIAQVALLVTKVNDLIAIIGNTPNTPDFTAQIAAIQEAIGTIASDNPAIQAALDATVPPANP